MNIVESYENSTVLPSDRFVSIYEFLEYTLIYLGMILLLGIGE